MIAVLSDIHGNLEALEAVLEDIAAQDIRQIVCLGDLVGYGPDPIQCVEHAMSWSVVLQGNFDIAAMADDDLPDWSAAFAKQTILQFRDRLKSHPRRDEIRSFLQARPTYMSRGGTMFVHGSPREPLHEYLFPERVLENKTMSSIAEAFDSLCLCGHTHLPGVFMRSDDAEWKYQTPDECGGRVAIQNRKLICNVGSVGQPRDNDPRAGYVVVDDESITFRRVEYDWETTCKKIQDDSGEDVHGERLRHGR